MALWQREKWLLRKVVRAVENTPNGLYWVFLGRIPKSRLLPMQGGHEQEARWMGTPAPFEVMNDSDAQWADHAGNADRFPVRTN